MQKHLKKKKKETKTPYLVIFIFNCRGPEQNKFTNRIVCFMVHYSVNLEFILTLATCRAQFSLIQNFLFIPGGQFVRDTVVWKNYR